MVKKLLGCCFCLLIGRAAFAQQTAQHLSQPENISNNSTFISGQGLNGNPNAVLIAELAAEDYSKNPHPIGVWYSGKQWAIFNQNKLPMPVGLRFNLSWATPGENTMLVKATAGHWILDHPALNNKPNASFSFCQVWNAGNQTGIYNDAHLRKSFNVTAQKWELKNADGTLAPVGAQVYVLIQKLPQLATGNPTATKNTLIRTGKLPFATNYYTDQRLVELLRTNALPEMRKYIQSLSLSQQLAIQLQTVDIIHSYHEAFGNKEGRRDQATGWQTIYDIDNDGALSTASGGDDCDDYNFFVHPGRQEICQPDTVFDFYGKRIVWISSLADEDCDPETVAKVVPDAFGNLAEPIPGDQDGDGLLDCRCANYGIGRKPQRFEQKGDAVPWAILILEEMNRSTTGVNYLIRGTDCDDTNPALAKNGQKCMSETQVAICVNGKWEVKPCRKCVTQPNGTGVVIEW